MKNRTLIGIICIVLALVVSFGIVPLFSKISESKTIEYRASKALSSGHIITEDDITAVEVNLNTVVSGSIADKNEIIGLYTVADMFSGDTITVEKLSETYDDTNDIYMHLDGTQVAVSVTISTFAGGLSAKLENGDIISFISKNSEGETVIPDELKYVRVITTTTADGQDNTELAENEDGTYELPSTVTVLVTPMQACKLVEYENSGKLHISLAYRGNRKTAQKFLDIQNEILEKFEAEKEIVDDFDTEEGEWNG